MNLHKLRVFRAVVERQSLTLAAQQLIVSQPVVSAHIRDLERFYGGKLLYQQGRRMLPTEAGEAVYRYATETLRATDEMRSIVRALETGEAGRVVLAANMNPGTYVLPRIVTEFKQRYPAAEVELLISDSATVYDETHRGGNDFAVVVADAPPTGLDAEVLCYEPLVLFANPDHPLARAGRATLEALAEMPFVCSPIGDGRPQLIEAMFRRLGLARRLVLTMGHPEAIKQAVLQGAGVAMLFRCALARELATGELREIAIEGQSLSHPFLLIHNPRKRFSPVQLRLIETLRERVPEVSSVGLFV